MLWRGRAKVCRIHRYSHDSRAVGSEMRFVVFLPKETRQQKVPFVIFLSGLTCNEVILIDRTTSSQNLVLLELRQSSVLL